MKLEKRIIISGKLKNLTPLHIGGMNENTLSDMPVITNGLGKHYIPATGLAGSMRSYLSKLFSDEHVNELFGFSDISTKSDEIRSSILIDDCEIEGDNITEIRHHNSIDRTTGVTAEHAKFDEEVIPAGREFKFNMEVKIYESLDEEISKNMISHLIEGLKNGYFYIGGHKTRGLGRIKLTNEKVYLYDFANDREQAILDFNDYPNSANTAKHEEDISEWKGEPDKIFNFLRLSIKCSLESQFISKSPGIGDEIDTTPVYSINAKGEYVPILPGSSLKGLLRSRADMILRTLLDDVSSPTISEMKEDQKYKKASDNEKYLANNRFLNRLFGTAIDYRGNEKDEYIRNSARLYCEDAYLYADNQIQKNESMHIKIDRISSGTTDGALYNFETICPQNTYFDLNVFIEDPDYFSLGIIGHALKDMLTGDLRVGFGTRKGFGKLKFADINQCDANLEGYGYISKEDVWDGNALTDKGNNIIDSISKSFNKTIEEERK